MSKPKSTMIAPKFALALTAQQALEIGRMSIIWGQIDHFTLSCVAYLLAKDMSAGTTMLGQLTTGPLVNMLRKSRMRAKDEAVQENIKSFCDDMGSLIDERNHVMHGIWGLHYKGKNPNKAKAACFYAKRPAKALTPEDVTKLANDAAVQTHVIAKIWYDLIGEPFPDGQPAYYWGHQTPNMPRGLQLKPLG